MDRLAAMSVFVAVADAGSLTSAARKLGVPLPTVSRKLSDLEAQLKTRLLVRSSRQIALTEAGQGYVAACRRILGDLADAERAALGEFVAPRGELVLTAPVVFGRLHVLPVVVAFLKAYPEIGLRMVLTDRVVHLLDDHIDLALRIGPLPDSRMIAVTLGTIRRVICASPGYLAARGTPAHPDDLAAHDCVAFDALMSGSRWALQDGATALAVTVRPRLVVNTAEAAIDAACAGLGVTQVLSYQVARALRAGQLHRVMDGFAPPAVPVSLVHAGGGRMPLKLRAFLDFAAPRLRASLAEATVPPGAAAGDQE